MTWRTPTTRAVPCAALAASLIATAHAGTLDPYGDEVVDYAPGANATAGYTFAAAALGAPERFTGEGIFPAVVSPFSPPFLAD